MEEGNCCYLGDGQRDEKRLPLAAFILSLAFFCFVSCFVSCFVFVFYPFALLLVLLLCYIFLLLSSIFTLFLAF